MQTHALIVALKLNGHPVLTWIAAIFIGLMVLSAVMSGFSDDTSNSNPAVNEESSDAIKLFLHLRKITTTKRWRLKRKQLPANGSMMNPLMKCVGNHLISRLISQTMS